MNPDAIQVTKTDDGGYPLEAAIPTWDDLYRTGQAIPPKGFVSLHEKLLQAWIKYRQKDPTRDEMRAFLEGLCYRAEPHLYLSDE